MKLQRKLKATPEEHHLSEMPKVSDYFQPLHRLVTKRPLIDSASVIDLSPSAAYKSSAQTGRTYINDIKRLMISVVQDEATLTESPGPIRLSSQQLAEHMAEGSGEGNPSAVGPNQYDLKQAGKWPEGIKTLPRENNERYELEFVKHEDGYTYYGRSKPSPDASTNIYPPDFSVEVFPTTGKLHLIYLNGLFPVSEAPQVRDSS